MMFRQTGGFDLRFQFHRVGKIAAGKQVREPVDDARRKIECLADLADRAASAIGDHIRGHGRAVFTVTAINFLDHRFPAIAAGQIEIDIWPAFAALVEKTFKNEMIFHRIDRRDPEAITNRAVSGAAPSLDHDVVFTAEVDDVPNNQKIAGKPELRDQGELFLDLMFYLRADRGVTLLRTEPDDSA